MDIVHSLNITKCSNCNELVDIPRHCGKFMELTNNQWVCWKGEHNPCCGKPAVVEFELCCDNPSF